MSQNTEISKEQSNVIGQKANLDAINQKDAGQQQEKPKPKEIQRKAKFLEEDKIAEEEQKKDNEIKKDNKSLKQKAVIDQMEISQWYYIDRKDANKVKGTVTGRDLEVLWKTNQIDAKTYVWKKNMVDWKPIMEAEDIKDVFNESTAEMFKIQGQFKTIKEQPSKAPDILDKAVDNLLGLLKSDITKKEDGGEGELLKKRPIRKGSKEIDFEGLTADEIKKIKKNKRKAEKKLEKKKSEWYQAKINTNIYIQGLPLDITFDEIKEHFCKAGIGLIVILGIIRIDQKTGKEKIKIYKDENDQPKGDGCVSYAKEESVEIAIEMLDQNEIRPGYPVTVDKAQFEQKGQDYRKRQKLEIDRVAAIKLKKDRERQFTWDSDDDEGEGLKIVIIKNIFTLDEVVGLNFFKELEMDIRQECESKLGKIKRIKLYENNPEGVVQIKFAEGNAAEACIELMNNRFFDGKKLQCIYFDGRTNYDIKESKEDEQKRIDEFGAWLESQEL